MEPVFNDKFFEDNKNLIKKTKIKDIDNVFYDFKEIDKVKKTYRIITKQREYAIPFAYHSLININNKLWGLRKADTNNSISKFNLNVKNGTVKNSTIQKYNERIAINFIFNIRNINKSFFIKIYQDNEKDFKFLYFEGIDKNIKNNILKYGKIKIPYYINKDIKKINLDIYDTGINIFKKEYTLENNNYNLKINESNINIYG